MIPYLIQQLNLCEQIKLIFQMYVLGQIQRTDNTGSINPSSTPWKFAKSRVSFLAIIDRYKSKNIYFGSTILFCCYSENKMFG